MSGSEPSGPTHLLCSTGTEVAFRKLSLTMERRHGSLSDRDRPGGPEPSFDCPLSPAPAALRAVSERDVSDRPVESVLVSGAKLSSRICLAL